MGIQEEDLQQFTADAIEKMIPTYGTTITPYNTLEDWNNESCKALLYYMHTGTESERKVRIHSYYTLQKVYQMYACMPLSIRHLAAPLIQKWKYDVLVNHPDDLELEDKIETWDDDEMDAYFKHYEHF